MNRISKFMYGMGISLTLLLAGTTALQAQAQGEGRQRQRPNRENFDPQQMRERMTARLREQLEVKDDAEWQLIQERLEKVMTARRESMMGGFGGGFGGRMGGMRPGGDNQDSSRRGPGMGNNPEGEALQKAIESKASSEEIKSKLAKLREARKAREAALEKAQNELSEVLSLRQEAILVSMGVLR